MGPLVTTLIVIATAWLTAGTVVAVTVGKLITRADHQQTTNPAALHARSLLERVGTP